MAIINETGEIELSNSDKEAMGMMTIDLDQNEIKLITRLLNYEKAVWAEAHSMESQGAMESLLAKLENNENN